MKMEKKIYLSNGCWTFSPVAELTPEERRVALLLENSSAAIAASDAYDAEYAAFKKTLRGSMRKKRGKLYLWRKAHPHQHLNTDALEAARLRKGIETASATKTLTIKYDGRTRSVGRVLSHVEMLVNITGAPYFADSYLRSQTGLIAFSGKN